LKQGGTMTSLMLVLMLQVASASTQFLVSTKAGLVNYVKGPATVKAAHVAPAGKPIITGQGGAVEILLNPGSYLRMGENTKVVLDKVDLADIAFRVLEGSAVIEANGFTKDLPLHVGTSALKMEIIKDGIYLIEDGKVVVVEGKIRDAGNGLTYGKGYQISDDQGYRAQKVKTFTTGLELWSQQRDAMIAQANMNVARSLTDAQNVPLGSLLDVWLWYPAFGSFIYMPGYGYHSPYGFNYYNAGQFYYGGGGGRYGSNGSGGTTSNALASNTSSNSSSGGGGFGSGGGGGAASQAAAANAQGSSRGATGGSAAPAARSLGK